MVLSEFGVEIRYYGLFIVKMGEISVWGTPNFGMGPKLPNFGLGVKLWTDFVGF